MIKGGVEVHDQAGQVAPARAGRWHAVAWPWAQPAWGGTAQAIVGVRDEYNLEKVAAAKPDVIIASTRA